MNLTNTHQATIYFTTTIIYNLYFHPLRHFPGPLLQRASLLPWAYQALLGRQPFITQKLHDRYGSVVRVAPNHLSFTDSRAWKDIYGHLVGHKSGSQEMSKTRSFNKSIDEIPSSILNAPREEHQRFRRALSHGFSDASMRQQAPTVVRHVDLLLKRLHEQCEGGKQALNSEAWYNWTTFDIAGDLTFGETFGCLQGSNYHPWIDFILKTVKVGGAMNVMDYLGFHSLVQLLFKYGSSAIKQSSQYTEAMLQNRLDMKEGREDLFEGLVRRKDEWVSSLHS